MELHDSLNNSIHEVQARLQHLRGVPTAQGVQDQTQLLPGEMPRPLFHMPPIIVPVSVFEDSMCVCPPVVCGNKVAELC